MTDYTKLVVALRNNDWSDACPCCDEAMCKDADCIIFQAADAIEALQAKEPTEKQVVDYCHKRCLVVIGEGLFHELKASCGKMPKRGEIVRCGECKWYKESPLLAPNKFCFRLKDRDGKRVGYNFDEHDYCSYGEMEVQDESAGSV